MYEFINTRFIQKITYTFNDNTLMKRIQDKSSKNINYDENLKKINFTKKKIDILEINKSTDELYEENTENKERCDVKIKEIMQREQNLNNNLDILTNCPSGKFHTWNFQKGDMICKNCQQSYNELVKLIQTSTATTQDDNKLYIHKLKIINLNKLAKKYCVSGDIHEFNEKNICIKCNKNPNEYSFSDKELEKMEKNIEEKTYEMTLSSIES